MTSGSLIYLEHIKIVSLRGDILQKPQNCSEIGSSQTNIEPIIVENQVKMGVSYLTTPFWYVIQLWFGPDLTQSKIIKKNQAGYAQKWPCIPQMSNMFLGINKASR